MLRHQRLPQRVETEQASELHPWGQGAGVLQDDYKEAGQSGAWGAWECRERRLDKGAVVVTLHRCNWALGLCMCLAELRVSRAAWAEGGVFTPLMSKGYWVDTCACPVAWSMVLSSLNQLSRNRAQLTQSSWKTTWANIFLFRLCAIWRACNSFVLTIKTTLVSEGRLNGFWLAISHGFKKTF